VTRALHFDCFSGISGDMTLGALIDVGVDPCAIRAGIDSLGLPVRMEVNRVRKGGFAATQVRIEAPPNTFTATSTTWKKFSPGGG
jgi:uncharacterized protein (DUF111 family)